MPGQWRVCGGKKKKSEQHEEIYILPNMPEEYRRRSKKAIEM
jgi:hypothetical protein